jgi:hypothetical protein
VVTPPSAPSALTSSVPPVVLTGPTSSVAPIVVTPPHRPPLHLPSS